MQNCGNASGEFESRAYVDTGPIGWSARLQRLRVSEWTSKEYLSHFIRSLVRSGFLGVLLTSIRVIEEEKAKLTPDLCGTCTRCLDACPTGALVAPYKMDATKCISYLTIEHKGEIAPELMEGMGRQVFRLTDICPGCVSVESEVAN